MQEQDKSSTIVDEKKLYSRPALNILGKVSELTAGAVSGVTEGENDVKNYDMKT
jgi:hypothetical protein